MTVHGFAGIAGGKNGDAPIFIGLAPVGAVEGSVLNRFGYVIREDVAGAFQVRDGPRDLQYPVVCPRRKPQLADGSFNLLISRTSESWVEIASIFACPGIDSASD